MIPLSLKIGQLFIVTLFFIAIFAKVYNQVFKWSVKDSIYNSIRIQTLNGGTIVAKTDLENFVISAQIIMAYLMTSGLIIVSLAI